MKIHVKKIYRICFTYDSMIWMPLNGASMNLDKLNLLNLFSRKPQLEKYEEKRDNVLY